MYEKNKQLLYEFVDVVEVLVSFLVTKVLSHGNKDVGGFVIALVLVEDGFVRLHLLTTLVTNFKRQPTYPFFQIVISDVLIVTINIKAKSRFVDIKIREHGGENFRIFFLEVVVGVPNEVQIFLFDSFRFVSVVKTTDH